LQLASMYFQKKFYSDWLWAEIALLLVKLISFKNFLDA